METVKTSPFILHQFLVTEFSIKRKPVVQGEVEFSITPSGLLDKENKTYTLIMNVELNDENGSFNIKLEGLGIFEFKEFAEGEDLSDYFYTNAPAILFPYVRAYIATVTALSGLEAVNLPTLNLVGMKDNLINNTKVLNDNKQG